MPTLGWWAYWPWETADDMFAMMLSDWGRQSLPWTSQEHDPYEPVLLLPKSDTTTYAAENAWVKICSASPQVTPTATQPFVHTITAPAWPITTDDPPAYLVTLQNQKFIAAAQFVEQSAIVNYQVCTRYCTGHPFVTGGGTGATSWTDTYSCAGGSN